MGMKRLLHVALAADDRYVRPLGVTMASVLCNRDGEDIRFHVLDDGISPAGRKGCATRRRASAPRSRSFP